MTDTNAGEWRSLFDGTSLSGWHAQPRIYGTSYPGGPSVIEFFTERGWPIPVEPENNPALWSVENGEIVGRQSAPGSGYGGYLVTDEKFGDFELELEARPDWPADTGIIVRRRLDDWTGFQILLDHRDHGGIGGFFGNGLGTFHILPFAIRGKKDADGNVVGLEPDDPETSFEPVTPEKLAQLTRHCTVEEFLDVWRWDDWNTMRIRVKGALPLITVWINDLLVAEIDAAKLKWRNYDPAAVQDYLGTSGHIALEVHDTDHMMGEGRWGRDSRCRWRNIRIRELS